jgi:hypothetical protein
MLLRFATYADWVHAVERYVAARGLAPDDVEALFAGNARAANPRLAFGSVPLRQPPASNPSRAPDPP